MVRAVTKFWIIVSVVFVIATLIASLIALYYKTACDNKAKKDTALMATPPSPRARPNSEYCKAVQHHLHNGAKEFGAPGLIAEIDSQRRTISVALPNASYVARGTLPDQVPPESGSFYLTHIDCDLSVIRIHPVWQLNMSKEIKVSWNK